MEKPMDKIIKALLIAFLFQLSIGSVFAQNKCNLKKICADEKLQDFDFRGQTTYAQLKTGDSISINIVAYARQELKVFACFEDKKLDNYYKIYQAKSIPEKKIRMISGKDTIFDVVKKTQLDIVFDSRKQNTEFWQEKIYRSARYIIIVVSPVTNIPREACVNIMVGKRPVN
jgi:hypothetical protein